MGPLRRSSSHRFRHLLSMVTLTSLVALSFSARASVALAPAPDEAEISPLFLDLPQNARSAALAPAGAAIRQRLAAVDLGVLADTQRNQTLRLNLFHDVTVIAERAGEGRTYGGGYAWVGRVPGQDRSTVILTRVNGAVAGMVVQETGETYEIGYAGGGRHVLRQVDSGLFPAEARPLEPPVDAGVRAQGPTAVGGAAAASPRPDDSTRIDLLVVYTDDARAAAGGTDAMLAEINVAVEATNQAYANSAIIQRLNLVHAAEVNYGESGDSIADLYRLQNASDGELDEVLALRSLYGADVVTFLVEKMESTACGRGFVMTTVADWFAGWAYSVVARHCALSNLSMAHELGHNMGGQHDWYVDNHVLPYSYAHGYVDVARRWRTIMAYNNECTAQTPAFSCQRLLYFSNPDVSYQGYRMGVPAGTNVTCVAKSLGNPDCDADMRSTLNSTRATVAGFYSRTDLEIDKRVTGPLVYGQQAVYLLQVTNVSGTSAMGPITVRDELPAALAFVSALGTGWSCAPGSPALTCERAGGLAGGAAAAPIRVTVQVPPRGTPPLLEVRNCATVSSPEDAGEPNNTSCIITSLASQSHAVYMPLSLRRP